jgi:peptidoglycan biosynthesis protein MviN/MurJ (putative lipid II flippase)
MRARLSTIRPEHKQIARGVAAVGTFVLAAKLIAMVKEIAIAWRYGVSPTVDSYLLVFNLVQYPASIWAGVIGAVLVPYAVRLRHVASRDLVRFRSELLGAAILLAVALTVGVWLLLPWVLQQPWIGLEAEQMALAANMVVPGGAILAVSILIWLWATWTMAGSRHVNTLLEGAPALVILLGVLIVGGSNTLMWATLFGFVLQAVLLLLSLRMHNDIEKPSFVFSSSHWRLFLSGIGVMLVGQALMNAVGLVDQLFAARLGPGAISSLGYANRLLGLLLALGTTTIGRAVLPVLSQAHVQGHNALKQVAFQWALLLGIVGLITAVVGIWLAPIGVQAMFQRGQFTAEDTARVADVLRYSLIQVPFYFASTALVYTLLSQGRQLAVAAVAAFSLILKISLSLALVPVLGLDGLVLATSGVYLAACLCTAWLIRKGTTRLHSCLAG